MGPAVRPHPWEPFVTDTLPVPRTEPQNPAAEIVQLTEELAVLGARAAALSDPEAASQDEPGTALVPAGGQHAVEAKARMARQLVQVRQLHEEIDTRQARLRKLMEAQMHAAYRALEPLKAQAKRIQEGITAITLYLGIEEGIETLRDGAPAPADTPVTLRQLVLSADQECLVAAELGGLDVNGLDDFFAWLLADDRHLDQILPEPKGIIALVPSRTPRHYGNDPWFNAAMAEANTTTFLLVRNGERVYAVFNDLVVGQRLFPAADEFAALFQDSWHGPMEPGSMQWKLAEEKADSTRRHYMKVGLLLQGLVDRTTILHPLPAQGLNLLDQAAIDDGRVVLIPDAEDSLALGDGREPFKAWQARINANLRPGMRIIVATRTEAFRSLAYGREDRRYGHPRLHPAGADAPDPDTIHVIESRRPDGSLVIRYERTDDVWTDRGRRPSRVRASCTVRADDAFVLAYDAADPDLMRSFLRNRVDRVHYLDMVPVINAAIAAKQEERAAEAPFRQMAVGMLMQHTGADLDQAEAAVLELTDWWKFANQIHRPLTGNGDDADAKAARAILAEYQRRQRTDHSRAAADVVQALTARHPGALLIAQTHGGQLVVLTPHADGPFVTEHTYTQRGRHRDSKAWVLPGARPNRWMPLHSTPQWEAWDRGATAAEYLAAPEQQQLAEEAVRLTQAQYPDRKIAAVTLLGKHTVVAWTIRSWGEADEDHPATGTVQTLTVEGFGFDWHRDRRQHAVAGRAYAQGQRDWDQWPGKYPWTSSWGQKVTVLQQFDDVVQRAEARHAHIHTVTQRRQEILEVARRAYRAAHSAWDQQREQDAYQAFMVEYGEPSLWEGHRKTIKLPAMPEPSDRTPGTTRLVGTSWMNALARLVEDGVDLAELTLGEALERQGVSDLPDGLHQLPLRPAR